MDIGSNDATFLKCYPNDLHRIGIDPTGNQFEEYYDNIKLIPTYFTKENIITNLGENIKFKCVSSISMFYDLPDPVQFAKDILEILDDNGIWTLEQSYIVSMLEKNSLDTICHEHLEYYAVRQIKDIMDRAGFKILDIQRNECNGGSFRCFVAKNSSPHTEAVALIQDYLNKETHLQGPAIYKQFVQNCDYEFSKLKHFLHHSNADQKSTYIYGASTKGNCLLQYANIGPTDIPFAVERNPLKFGLMTATKIPIISEEEMRSNPPQFQLVLPWHFRDAILSREQKFLDDGGQFIFPLPKFEIYSRRPKVLITGIHGQIAQYVIKSFQDDYQLYGIGQNRVETKSNVTCFYFDLRQTDILTQTILTINPDLIIHLAGQSNFDSCENNLKDTLDINGMITVNICEIIHREKLKTKLFAASSCLIYEGHEKYEISDDDFNFKPKSAYGLAKTFAHQSVVHYRQRFGHHFSNGILFTTESKHRQPTFLLKKVAQHAKNWSQTHSSLELYELNASRNIVHASDVAAAIKIIVSQEHGSDYLIGGDEFSSVSDLVLQLYKNYNIILYRQDNTFYDTETKLPVIKIIGSNRQLTLSLNGTCTKLKSLGWSSQYSTSDILRDL